MSCPSPEDLSALVDGELAPLEAARIISHARTCSSCREELEELKSLSRLFDTARDGSPGRSSAGTAYHVRRIAAAAVFLLGVGLLVTQSGLFAENELRFEAYLERSIDRDVLEVSELREEDLSRDRVVGLLISSVH